MGFIYVTQHEYFHIKKTTCFKNFFLDISVNCNIIQQQDTKTINDIITCTKGWKSL